MSDEICSQSANCVLCCALYQRIAVPCSGVDMVVYGECVNSCLSCSCMSWGECLRCDPGWEVDEVTRSSLRSIQNIISLYSQWISMLAITECCCMESQ